MARTSDQTEAEDPVLALLAKRKAEAVARAEKEHNQLAAAARLFAQGTKTVNDAEENLRKGRDKQDSAIASMLDAGLDAAVIAETLGITSKAVAEAVKRRRAATGAPEPAKAKPAATRSPRARPAESERAPGAAEKTAAAASPAPETGGSAPDAGGSSPADAPAGGSEPGAAA